MKQRAITIAVTKGYPVAAAKLIWQKVKDNCGAEPTAEMLSDYDRAAYEKAGVAPPLAKAWSEAFRVVKKGKFRPGKPYTAAEYVAFYVANPNDEVLIAAINLACEGKPWVVYTDKYHSEQMTQFIGWHLNEDPAPATIDVDGEPVTPVMPGEEKVKKVKLYWVDPHTPGGFLNVEMKSPRTNADFSGYIKNMGTPDEDTSAFQAMIFLCGRDLKPETPRSLKLHAEECRGSSARDILSDYAETLAAWNKLPADQRPKAKMAKEKAAVPFADAARAVATARVVSPVVTYEIPNDTEFVALPHEMSRKVASTLVQLGIMAHRPALVAGFNAQYQLNTHNNEMVQAMTDLSYLSQTGRLLDGTVPLRQYLTSALDYAAQRPEAAIIYSALLATFAPAPAIRTVLPEPKYNISITGSNIGSISVGSEPESWHKTLGERNRR